MLLWCSIFQMPPDSDSPSVYPYFHPKPDFLEWLLLKTGKLLQRRTLFWILFVLNRSSETYFQELHFSILCLGSLYHFITLSINRDSILGLSILQWKLSKYNKWMDGRSDFLSTIFKRSLNNIWMITSNGLIRIYPFIMTIGMTKYRSLSNSESLPTQPAS